MNRSKQAGMGKKTIVVLLVGLALASVHLADAQQPTKIPRIGYVSGTGNPSDPGPYVEALRQGLRDLGHFDGKNILIEYRGAEGKVDRIPSLVAELVQLNVDVLVVVTLSSIRAAKQATKTIPIVMVTGDPVASGIVDSLARPGGNITGLATLSRDLSGKRLEMLSEAVPRLSRVGVLWNADEQTGSRGVYFKEYETAARALKIELQSLEVRGPNPDLQGAFQTAAKGRAGGLITITSAPLFLQRKRIADLAIKNRLPSMYQGSAWVEAGGLMSYSADDLEAFRRAATYVDKILKGTKPADLPVEQPTKFELVINLKTAKALGLTIPPVVLMRAEKVIK
jgi:putative tryptophan/tyrosine transport system substrate-binding protein